MKDMWLYCRLFLVLFMALSAGACQGQTVVWYGSLDDAGSIASDGGEIVNGPASFVAGVEGNAFAGNGSVYASWDNTDVADIFDGVWDNDAGSTIDLYFRGDHWDSHSGDSGFWSVVDRYGGDDGYYILSVRNGSLRFPYKDSYNGYTEAPHLTGIALVNNVTYRLTVRQLDTDFEVYLDGGAYSNSFPVYSDNTWNETIAFPENNTGSPGREMSVGSRAVFGGELQSGDWVDSVRVYNGFYTPADIDSSSGCSVGDVNDDCIVSAGDLKVVSDNWLGEGLSRGEGNIFADEIVNLCDFALMAQEWLLGTTVMIVSEPSDVEVYIGNEASFRVDVTGPGLIEYQWQKGGVNLEDGGDISGARTARLEIANTETSDEGQYRCVVKNEYSTVISEAAALTVILGVPVGRQTLYEANTNRRYILYVPTDYNPPQKLYPLIISSHGTSQNGDTEMDSTGSNSGFDHGTPTWPTLAEENDVIVACPDMTGAYGNPDNQLAPGQLAQLASDDDAIMNIISEIQAAYEIDTQRIFITGFSGGGHVAHYTGLRHPDVFNALCARHGNFNVEETHNPLPDDALNMNAYIFTGDNDSVYGTSEAITWYTAQGFNYVDTDYFSTYPSSEHTTDRHHALNWFLNLNLGVGAGGHYVRYNGETLMLIGESGTQCAAQNSNLDHREWIDDCAMRGIRAIHIWSFVPVRQKQDGSQIEDRWGYVVPDVMPWARKTSGPLALDQRYQWDLKLFDEGAEGDFTHYWPRLRDMCAYARSKGIVVGITMFTGWSKHDYSWIFHPLNAANGGHLSDKANAVTIASPGVEVWREPWSDGWSNAKKTQWVWEQLSIKFINEVGSLGNVFFVFFDEHSYSEGNMGDHFMDFFKRRGQVWVDWNASRSDVAWVMSDTLHSTDKNSNATAGFNGNPVRPYFNLEGPPYMGAEVRTSIWTFSMGGGNFIFHADERQETVRTGIMGYDPSVPGGDKGMYKRDWLGHASRFFNEHVSGLDTMSPRNGLSSSGVYCLADEGGEYVLYSGIGVGGAFTVDLSAAAGKTLNCRFYNPRTGIFNSTFQRPGGNSAESFTKPDSNDWVLHLVEN